MAKSIMIPNLLNNKTFYYVQWLRTENKWVKNSTKGEEIYTNVK